MNFVVLSGNQVSVSPKIDFVDDSKNDPIPPKIQGLRVIVDTSKMSGKCVSIVQKFSSFSKSVLSIINKLKEN